MQTALRVRVSRGTALSARAVLLAAATLIGVITFVCGNYEIIPRAETAIRREYPLTPMVTLFRPTPSTGKQVKLATYNVLNLDPTDHVEIVAESPKTLVNRVHQQTNKDNPFFSSRPPLVVKFRHLYTKRTFKIVACTSRPRGAAIRLIALRGRRTCDWRSH